MLHNFQKFLTCVAPWHHNMAVNNALLAESPGSTFHLHALSCSCHHLHKTRFNSGSGSGTPTYHLTLQTTKTELFQQYLLTANMHHFISVNNNCFFLSLVSLFCNCILMFFVCTPPRWHQRVHCCVPGYYVTNFNCPTFVTHERSLDADSPVCPLCCINS